MVIDIGGKKRHVSVTCKCILRKKAETDKAEAERTHLAKLAGTGLQTGNYARMTLANWQDTGVVEPRVQAYISAVSMTGRNWLFLHGGFGLGKTHLAVAATRQIAVEHFWSAAIVRWAEYCSKIQQGWSDKNIKNDWAAARASSILVIDDLDKKPSSPWPMEQLFELLDYRYCNTLPTIFTANSSPSAMNLRWGADVKVAELGQAVMSRIIGSLADAVEFEGEDYRLK